MPPSPLRWDDVPLFLALMRRGSLAAAGKDLGLDPSTVSRRLSSMEESMGKPLFDRHREGLRLTDLAQLLLPIAVSAEESVIRMQNAAAATELSVEGLVRITAPPGMVELFLVREVARLRELYPRLVMELDASREVADLSRREADVAVRTIRPKGGELLITKLAEIEYVTVASQAYAQRVFSRPGQRPSMVRWSDRYLEIAPAAWMATHASQFDTALVADSLVAQAVAASVSLGVALLPEPVAALYGLVRVELFKSPIAFPRETHFLVGHKALRHVPRVAAVWNHLTTSSQAALLTRVEAFVPTPT